jgi:glutaredoxin
MTDKSPPPILVLGRDTCQDTTRSRALLERRGIPFTYRTVDEDAEAEAWIRRLNGGGLRTPTILVGDPDRPATILREPSDAELLAALGLASTGRDTAHAARMRRSTPVS